MRLCQAFRDPVTYREHSNMSYISSRGSGACQRVRGSCNLKTEKKKEVTVTTRARTINQ